MAIAWHPSRWWDWCIPKDEKKETEKLWAYTWTFLYLETGYKKEIKGWPYTVTGKLIL